MKNKHTTTNSPYPSYEPDKVAAWLREINVPEEEIAARLAESNGGGTPPKSPTAAATQTTPAAPKPSITEKAHPVRAWGPHLNPNSFEQMDWMQRAVDNQPSHPVSKEEEEALRREAFAKRQMVEAEERAEALRKNPSPTSKQVSSAAAAAASMHKGQSWWRERLNKNMKEFDFMEKPVQSVFRTSMISMGAWFSIPALINGISRMFIGRNDEEIKKGESLIGFQLKNLAVTALSAAPGAVLIGYALFGKLPGGGGPTSQSR